MKKYLAELLGTFVLVFIGCGSAAIAGADIGFAGIAFAFGLAVLAMVYTIGPISGCHINPAITVAMFSVGRISAKDTLMYVIYQVLGAILAAGALYLILQSNESLGQNGYGALSPRGHSLQAAFIAEVLLTAIFLVVVLGATSANANTKFAGLAIGLALVFIHLVGIPITGTSVNPARSIGPALFVGGDALNQVWLFVVAPLLGGLFGGVLWKYVLGGD